MFGFPKKAEVPIKFAKKNDEPREETPEEKEEKRLVGLLEVNDFSNFPPKQASEEKYPGVWDRAVIGAFKEATELANTNRLELLLSSLGIESKTESRIKGLIRNQLISFLAQGELEKFENLMSFSLAKIYEKEKTTIINDAIADILCEEDPSTESLNKLKKNFKLADNYFEDNSDLMQFARNKNKTLTALKKAGFEFE